MDGLERQSSDVTRVRGLISVHRSGVMCGDRRIHRTTKSTPLTESRNALEGIVQKFPRRRRRVPYRRAVALCSAVLTVLAGAAVVDGAPAAAAAGPTTAWQHGDF